mgnify:CR=1 FL=1
MSTKELVIDMAVMASDASLIKMVKDVFPVIRGIYHVKSYEKLIDVVHTANRNYAGVVALDQSLVSHDVVEYLHARFKTVWVLQEEETDFELHNSIVSGCYGMIVKDYANLRFPKNADSSSIIQDSIRKYSSLYTNDRDSKDMAFDDLTRLYFVAFSRAKDVLLLVGLNPNIDGYKQNEKQMKIPFLQLSEYNHKYASQLKEAANRVIDSGWYLNGIENKSLEQEICNNCGAMLACESVICNETPDEDALEKWWVYLNHHKS